VSLRQSSLLVVGGQVLWALGQAAVVLLLASNSMISLVGLLTLGLSVFAPICLVGGLNLRTLIAIDDSNSISIAVAIRLRFIFALFALAITVALLNIVSDNPEELIVVVALLGTRVADQLSDIAVGGFQRSGHHELIARSFAVRGAACAIPFGILWFLNGSVLVAAVASCLAALGATVVFDLRPQLTTTAACPPDGGPNLVDFFKGLGKSLFTAPFPLLDSLHFNCFRYAIFMLASLEVLGLVGIAQTLYAPVQLLISAMGYRYLTKARQLKVHGTHGAFQHHVRVGTLLGLWPGTAFILLVAIVPALFLEPIFVDQPETGRNILLAVGIAMLPLGAAAFAAGSLVARGDVLSYVTGPVIGLSAFFLFLWPLSLVGTQDAVITVGAAFFISSVLRLAFSLQRARRA
jgi:O-antigen/teichoic acid export membrane protein